jgi:hypothetical protein
MNNDLTVKLDRAQASTVNWSEAFLLQLTVAITNIVTGSKWDWDPDTGEEWGRILLGTDVVAVFWLRAPFVFANDFWYEALRDILESNGVIVEPVSDWDRRIYSLKPEAVPKLFGGRTISNTLNFACFSVNELWWATV